MSAPPEIIDAPPRSPLLLSYLRLFRLPNVFTAVADVTMGCLFASAVDGRQPRVEVLLCLIGASSSLYTAGMVLNDVYDLEVDRQERPNRPLPSGAISPRWAMWLGYELLVLGLALGWLAGLGMHGPAVAALRTGGVATALAVCIVAYDAGLKKTLLGPLAMGSCRLLNVLMGMSMAALAEAPDWRSAGFSISQLLVAGGIGVYIAGVTWFARSEAEESNSLLLLLGMAVMIGGLAMLGIFPNYSGRGILHGGFQTQPYLWLVLLALISLTPLRRCGAAVLGPSPQRVQTAVKMSILTLIVLDAGVVLAVAGPYFAVGVLALLAPAFLLGRWVYST
jgi:4-hydroxybenzoate polyprenyltransferase